jgi:signal transduction histidine kinase
MVETGGAELTIHDDLTFEAAPDRVSRLFENLVRNAIEHGGPDVTVTVGVLDDRGGIYVADNGIGIPPEERENVFTAGYTTSETGTGLGLAIVGEIASAHGWAIRVTESAAGGTRFEIKDIALIE